MRKQPNLFRHLKPSSLVAPFLPVHFFKGSRWNHPVWTKPVSLQSNISPALHRRNFFERNSYFPIPIKSDQIFRSPFLILPLPVQNSPVHRASSTSLYPLATPPCDDQHLFTSPHIYSFEERRTTFGWHFKTNREVRQLTFLIGWNEIFNNRGCGLGKNSLLY